MVSSGFDSIGFYKFLLDCCGFWRFRFYWFLFVSMDFFWICVVSDGFWGSRFFWFLLDFYWCLLVSIGFPWLLFLMVSGGLASIGVSLFLFNVCGF